MATLSSPLALNFGTTYWVVVERTGSPDATHMFGVGLDMRRWATRCAENLEGESLGRSGAQLRYALEVWGKRETTAQIGDMVGPVLPAADHRSAERHLCAPVACG